MKDKLNNAVGENIDKSLNQTGNSIKHRYEEDLDSKLKLDKPIKIPKKTTEKRNKKAINLFIDESLNKKLENIMKKTKYSKTELITMFIEACCSNYEIDEE